MNASHKIGEWQPDDAVVLRLAQDIIEARRTADRVERRRLRRVADTARIAAWSAEQRAVAAPTPQNVNNAFARQLVVAALNLADDPMLSRSPGIPQSGMER